MTQISVKTTNTSITYATRCVDDVQHKVVYDLQGNLVSYEHDIEAEDVALFLGGQPTQCARARSVHEAALERINFLSGLNEPSSLVSLSDSQWKIKNGTCGRCDTARSFEHYVSVDHLLGLKDVGSYARQAEAAIKRILAVRSISNQQIFTLDGLVAALGFELDINRGNQGIAGWMNPLVRGRFVTTSFVDAARPFIRSHRQIDYLFFLRDSFTLDWLKTFHENLSQKALANVGEAPELMRKISKARNKSPELVAEYVNLGIYSHIYTYISEHISPRDALRIFQNYPDARSAKDLLDRNESVSRALHRLNSA